jgi:CheY-like chemotaxis protein
MFKIKRINIGSKLPYKVYDGDAGVDVFLQKPINPSILNDILSGIFLEDNKISYSPNKDVKSLKDEILSLSGSKILLTEDNEINQEIIIGLLENSNIEIDIAKNGKEAVRMYKNNPAKYELILMDLQMPIMDGFEATKIIRAQDKNIPIIALTALTFLTDSLLDFIA